MLLFYIRQNITLTKVAYSREPYIMPRRRYRCFLFTNSCVRHFVITHIYGNWKLRHWGCLLWHYVKIGQLVQKFKVGHTHTHTHRQHGDTIHLLSFP